MGNDKLHKRAFAIEKRMERIRTPDKPTKERRLDIKFGESEFRGDEVLTINGFQTGPVTQRLYDTLTGIQWGTLPDDMGWTQEVE